MGMIFLSENASASLIHALEEKGHEIYRVCSSDTVYPAISAHADIYMCRVGNTLVIDDACILDPPLRDEYMDIMESHVDDFTKEPVIPSLSGDGQTGSIVFEMGGIGHDYPDDVPYNALATGRYFIHNTDLTSPSLLDRARYCGLQMIRVRQGYTRCSCLPVGDRAVITADEGIARTLRAWNEMLREEAAENAADGAEDPSVLKDLIDILLIRQGYIGLEGFDHGFIGGCGGTVDDTIYFNGDLTEHPDSDLIIRFIEDHGFRPVWFQDEPLTDIGSIFCI